MFRGSSGLFLRKSSGTVLTAHVFFASEALGSMSKIDKKLAMWKGMERGSGIAT
jgi:hypothetical protein